MESVLEIICNGNDESELSEYCVLCLHRIKLENDQRLNDYVEKTRPEFLTFTMKRVLILTVLNLDWWMQDWVFSNHHDNRLRPGTSPMIKDDFLFGLATYARAYQEEKLDAEQFVVATRKYMEKLLTTIR